MAGGMAALRQGSGHRLGSGKGSAGSRGRAERAPEGQGQGQGPGGGIKPEQRRAEAVLPLPWGSPRRGLPAERRFCNGALRALGRPGHLGAGGSDSPRNARIYPRRAVFAGGRCGQIPLEEIDRQSWVQDPRALIHVC